jgi:hypothetical protein
MLWRTEMIHNSKKSTKPLSSGISVGGEFYGLVGKEKNSSSDSACIAKPLSRCM